MKLRIMCVTLFISITVFLTGCTAETDNKIRNFLTADIKNLAKLGEDFQLSGEDSKIKLNGVDIDYKNLDGYKNILDIYSVKEIERTIMYNSKVKSGKARLFIVDASGKAVDIVRNSGDGSINIKLPSGKSTIKLLGSSATGNIKIDIPSAAEDEIKALGTIAEDGEYFFWKDNGSQGDNISIKVFRISVVNKKVDKLAKIEIKGKLENGKVTSTFDEDGWGNSGTAEVSFQRGTTITIAIKNKDYPSAEWGIKEGTFTPTETKLPDFVKGL